MAMTFERDLKKRRQQAVEIVKASVKALRWDSLVCSSSTQSMHNNYVR